MTEVAAAGEAPAVEITTTPAAAPGSSSPDVETTARKQGWVPKDEWPGDPENWKDAATYVEHGDLKTRLAKAEKSFDDRVAKLEKTNAKTLEQLQKQHEKELTDLRAEKRAAVAKGDVKAVDAIDEQIDALKADKPTAEKAAKSGDGDEASAVADWQFENSSWYGKDETMTRYAETYATGLPEGLAPADIRRKVDAKMREKFPDHDFGKKAATTTTKTGANGHASVDGGGGFDAPARNDPLSKLPNEARAQAKADMAKFPKIYPNAESWIKTYEAK